MVDAKVSYHLPVNATDLPRALQNYYSCRKKWCVLLLLSSVVPQRWAQQLFCVTTLDISSIHLILHDAHWLPLLLIVRSLSTYISDFPHGHAVLTIVDSVSSTKTDLFFSLIFFRFYDFLSDHFFENFIMPTSNFKHLPFLLHRVIRKKDIWPYNIWLHNKAHALLLVPFLNLKTITTMCT